MIDLHLHTTASDGRLTPEALVTRAVQAGLTTISVTDHDTTSGVPEASAAAARYGLRLVPGIEITAVERGRDIHVLGYFIDPRSAPLIEFLRAQRADRLRRLTLMVDRLRDLGYPIDGDPLMAEAARDAGRTLGRPQVADALVASGYVLSRREAFETLLGEGRPGFVPRNGATVGEVSAIVRASGGVASLAHPGIMEVDDDIPAFVAAGLPALEVWHSDHDERASARYLELAGRLGVATTGGSDYHADDSHHAAGLGSVTVPEAAFAHLESLAGRGPDA